MICKEYNTSRSESVGHRRIENCSKRISTEHQNQSEKDIVAQLDLAARPARNDKRLRPYEVTKERLLTEAELRAYEIALQTPLEDAAQFYTREDEIKRITKKMRDAITNANAKCLSIDEKDDSANDRSSYAYDAQGQEIHRTALRWRIARVV